MSKSNDAFMADFQRQFDQLPDREAPPTDIPLYRGDMCKVKGTVWVYDGVSWHSSEDKPISDVSLKK